MSTLYVPLFIAASTIPRRVCASRRGGNDRRGAALGATFALSCAGPVLRGRVGAINFGQVPAPRAGIRSTAGQIRTSLYISVLAVALGAYLSVYLAADAVP